MLAGESSYLFGVEAFQIAQTYRAFLAALILFIELHFDSVGHGDALLGSLPNRQRVGYSFLIDYSFPLIQIFR